MMRFTVLSAIALVAAPGAVIAESGYAHGSDHCYYFQTPAGWQMDNHSAAAAGVPMVFYPQGATWQSAEVAMYTRPAPPLRGTDAIKAQVEDVIAMYRRASESVTAKQARQVKTRSGALGQLWAFSGYRNGGTELAVYFLGPKTVNYLVAQVPRGASVEKAKQTLVELASSYREGTDCKPCAEAGSCKQEN
jgi:hypothetical protein